MSINLDLYNIINLPNGNILLKLKKEIDNTQYNLVLTDISFYKACKKNIGILNIYEPTNLTPQLLKIIIDETEISLLEFQFHKKNRTNMAIRWYYEHFLTIFNQNLCIITRYIYISKSSNRKSCSFTCS